MAENIPNWVEGLISSGVVMLILGILIKSSILSLINKIDECSKDIKMLSHEFHEFRINEAEIRNHLITEKDILKNDLRHLISDIDSLKTSSKKAHQRIDELIQREI